MSIKSSSSKSKSSSSTSATNHKVKMLADLLARTSELGFQVRREKLKQGHGWRAMSGSCVLKGQKVLFLDSKTSLDEQIHFVSSWLAGSSEQATTA